MKKSNKNIIIEQFFNKSITEVWAAITELDQMTQWFFENIEEFKAVVDFETQFVVQSEERKFTHQWRITEVIPLKKIVYNWKYEEYPGNAHVTFELFEEEKGTKMRLTNQELDNFPNDIPEFSEASCREGWNYFIGQRLKDYLK